MIHLFKDKMKKELELIGLSLTEYQLDQFYQYYELLVEWNKVMNLTAIIEMDDVITKHFIDSLALVLCLDGIKDKSYKLIDVGTGAGFPGIPLKILNPELNITLLDSLNKRVKFLDEVSKKLKLDNMELLHGRAEDYGRNIAYREQYDVCVSRAVANLSVLSEYCIPFVKTEGYFISYKSGKIEEELSGAKGSISLLGSCLEDVNVFELPNTDVQRSLVKVRKVKKLSNKYPRKSGIPTKEPLS